MTTRLYLAFDVFDKKIVLPSEEAHYLTRVLRLKVGDVVHVYNEQVGEWRAELSAITKSSCEVLLLHQVRESRAEPVTCLVYAPLKHDAMSFLFEKATELGVTHLQPMTTDFSQKYTLHTEKIMRQLKQASQQCERLSVPVLLAPIRFEDALREDDQAIYGCRYIALERSDGLSLLSVLAKKEFIEPCTLIIGPEGGFSVREIDLINRMPGVQAVSLGKTVLRAETAAIVGLGAISMWRE